MTKCTGEQIKSRGKALKCLMYLQELSYEATVFVIIGFDIKLKPLAARMHFANDINAARRGRSNP